MGVWVNTKNVRGVSELDCDKVYNEFSLSTKKVNELNDCFDFLEQPYYELEACFTKWVSLYKAVDKLLKATQTNIK